MQTIDLLTSHGHQVVPFASHDPGGLVSDFSNYFVDDLIGRERKNLVVSAVAASRGIYNLQARDRLQDLINDSNPDIAHIHNLHFQISPSILHTLRDSGIPVVMTLHDYRLVCPNGYLFTQGSICERCKSGQFYNALRYRCLRDSWEPSLVGATAAYAHNLLKIYRYVDRYIAPSQFLREKMVEFGYEQDRIVHIPNFLRRLERPLENIHGQSFLFVGFMVPQKGPHIVLRALLRLPDCRVNFVGDGPMLGSLRRLASDLGLADRVKFTGFLGDSELGDVIQQTTALLVPSLWYENAPMAILEAFAFGRPVIASRIGGIQEMVQHGLTGFLIPAGDPESLADAMKYLAEHPRKAQTFGVAGRQLSEERFHPDTHYAALESLYRDVRSKATRRQV